MLKGKTVSVTGFSNSVRKNLMRIIYYLIAPRKTPPKFN
jgi:hypothetical protein